ncbi:hypothetical protein ACFW7J_24750 [Streptomyces sp. NPDC059525]|uniref:hypothetical protein n=1 Tax=Streptomyces sp. NPDC059525 TaxID=3346857 RepID=UPI0036C88DCA
MNSFDSSRTLVRVPGRMVSELVEEGLVEPIVSESRALGPDEFVQLAVIAKDTASAVVAVVAGIKGVHAILNHLRKRRETPASFEVVVFSEGSRQSWSVSSGGLSEEAIEEITSALRRNQDPSDGTGTAAPEPPSGQ